MYNLAYGAQTPYRGPQTAVSAPYLVFDLTHSTRYVLWGG
jgi:hypothetical protein